MGYLGVYIFLVMPKGIGLSVMANNIDVNKVMYLCCLLVVIGARIQYSRLHFGLDSIGVLAFVELNRYRGGAPIPPLSLKSPASPCCT